MRESGHEPRVRNCNPYARGKRFEYRTREYLRKSGWFVIRQPRSAFPDLIGLRDGSIILVECKLSGHIPSIQRRRIVRLARRQARGEPILACKRNGQLFLRKLSYKRASCDKPFDPDSVNGKDRR